RPRRRTGPPGDAAAARPRPAARAAPAAPPRRTPARRGPTAAAAGLSFQANRQMPSTLPLVTRLAPSPTGAQHLGNARTYLVAWLLARQAGGRVVLRIEDIDSPRVKPGAAEQALADLRWLGLDWDAGPIVQT